MSKKKIPELKIEHVTEAANLKFLALLEYKRDQYLVIVDNITPVEIGAYVLDYAEQEQVPVSELLSIVTRWFYGSSEKHPLSVEISRHGLTERLAPIYRTFDTQFVARIIGNAFVYDGMGKSKVRRRRVVPVPAGIEIRLKRPD